jgi:2-(1,2-epoxy-1,2-dihydrophenyl)acetyl-CoA isomerase
MSEQAGAVLLTIEDGVAEICFNRPKVLNALNLDACTALLAACEKLSRMKDLRVVVLRGEGPSFMAGGDLSQFRDAVDRPAFTREILEPLNASLLILDELPLPVIASVQGAAAGAGASIALAADLVIAADDAKFIMAYAKVGTSLDGGSTWALPRLIGLHRAMEMALLAEPVAASQALAMGLINRVVPLAELQNQTRTLVRRISAGPTAAYGKIKRLLRDSSTQEYAVQLKAELEAFVSCAATSDFGEGLAAFFAKRTADFRGH